MKLIHTYINGNYRVSLFDDGTKFRKLLPGETEYKPEFPENIDCCISKKCSIGCPFCYESCTPEGKYFDYYSARRVLSQLKPGTELALGGGALTEIPFEEFLKLLNIIPSEEWAVVNATFNAKELVGDSYLAKALYEDRVNYHISGIGISYNRNYRDTMLKFKMKHPKYVVIHTIYGVTSPDDYKWLAENHFKVLILGYKNKGRGMTSKDVCFNKEYATWVDENILSFQSKFKTLSFDCLAVEQINIREKVGERIWNKFYMGDDGQFTMYLDLVNNQFAQSSTTSEYHNIHTYGSNLSLMFNKIKER